MNTKIFTNFRTICRSQEIDNIFPSQVYDGCSRQAGAKYRYLIHIFRYLNDLSFHCCLKIKAHISFCVNLFSYVWLDKLYQRASCMYDHEPTIKKLMKIISSMKISGFLMGLQEESKNIY